MNICSLCEKILSTKSNEESRKKRFIGQIQKILKLQYVEKFGSSNNICNTYNRGLIFKI